MCVCAYMCEHRAHVWRPEGNCSLLPLCESQGWNTGPQALQQVPLPPRYVLSHITTLCQLTYAYMMVYITQLYAVC